MNVGNRQIILRDRSVNIVNLNINNANNLPNKNHPGSIKRHATDSKLKIHPDNENERQDLKPDEPEAKKPAISSDKFNIVLKFTPKQEVTGTEPATPQFALEFDKENQGDLAALSLYVQEIFEYYKSRESVFKVHDYFHKHSGINPQIRAKLVDWMVEMQEVFEMNHETLYLGVKLVDLFLDRTSNVKPSFLQTIAAASMFIASKYDERAPPLIEEFLSLIKDDAVTRECIMKMERNMLNVINFDIGMPLSYRFLRRYARVSKLEMHTLTLARYILELSLMFLNFCRVSESLMAAASLSLALRMKKICDWTPLLTACSGYSQEDIEPLVWSLNHMVIQMKKGHKHLETVVSKYSHEVFFEVALVESLEDRLKDQPIGPPSQYLGAIKK